MSDLVRRAQAGDESAFGELYRDHRDRIYALCLRLEAEPERAMERMQDVFVRGVAGELDLSTVSGRIRVEGSARQISAESIDGNIEIEGHAPFTRVKTAGGTILLRFPRGDVAASSVTGGILVGGADLERGRFESVSGPVSFKGAIRRGGTLELASHSGAVELRLPPETAADFEISAFAGALRNELGREQPDRGAHGRPLRFSTNGGGALVTVRTFKGSVALIKQPR